MNDLVKQSWENPMFCNFIFFLVLFSILASSWLVFLQTEEIGVIFCLISIWRRVAKILLEILVLFLDSVTSRFLRVPFYEWSFWCAVVRQFIVFALCIHAFAGLVGKMGLSRCDVILKTMPVETNCVDVWGNIHLDRYLMPFLIRCFAFSYWVHLLLL